MVRLFLIGFIASASALLGGCVSLPAVSSGQVGCSEDQIKISNDKQGFGTRTWTAECGGKRFFCSALQGDRSAQVSCKPEHGQEEPATKAAPDATAGGCKFDTQCKGERVCVQGQCVEPTSKGTSG